MALLDLLGLNQALELLTTRVLTLEAVNGLLVAQHNEDRATIDALVQRIYGQPWTPGN